MLTLEEMRIVPGAGVFVVEDVACKVETVFVAAFDAVFVVVLVLLTKLVMVVVDGVAVLAVLVVLVVLVVLAVLEVPVLVVSVGN